MSKIFNVTGNCQPEIHYMVDLSERLKQIRAMVNAGQYFTINRARQYGKTTILQALEKYLQKDYLVVSMDFQMLSFADFENEAAFTEVFSRELLNGIVSKDKIPEQLLDQFQKFADGQAANGRLSTLFPLLSRWCGAAERPIVLMIDEVDSATNNQVFLDFLAQLRGYYLKRNQKPTFQSVILAGVYDIKILKPNSPWNTHVGNEENGSLLTFDDCPWDQKEFTPFDIAADFLVDMNFSVKDISGMLGEYEEDCHTGMDVTGMAQLIYDYTMGYPFLVSRLCKLMDERIAGNTGFPDKRSVWTKAGFLEALNMLLVEKNTLFESLAGKVMDYPELQQILYALLFQGQNILYSPDNPGIELAIMFGFVKVENGIVVVANRIFETRLYNMFLTAPEEQNTDTYRFALQNKNQFIKNGHLNMKLVLEKFVAHFDELYGDKDQTFYEEDGRRYFLLYLRPIINGVGNYYIEARTRNMERTDVIVDYGGEQLVVELKIWRGEAYNTRGEEQLVDYLNHYHLKKGYMLSFNFNKKKEIGVKEIALGDKLLVEAVV